MAQIYHRPKNWFIKQSKHCVQSQKYFKDVLEGVQTFISWENKELSAKEIDVMLESSLSKICIQAVKGERKPSVLRMTPKY